MLKHKLIHPEINAILGRAGHHAKVLIADGNYPASSTLGPHATLISLNLTPGVVSCTQVLEALLATIPIEVANTMQYVKDGEFGMQSDPPIWEDYRRLFKAAQVDVPLTPIEKWDFYKAVNTTDHVLTIQTAEQQLWANLLLSIGVRKPGE